jgi:DNA-binding MarR family transcriptional regulator
METDSSITNLDIFLTSVKKEQFTMFPHWLRDMKGVKGFDKQVYLTIKSYAWDYILCYPCLDTIAEHLDCSIKTIQRSIKRLVNNNLLIVLSRKEEGKSNVFFILTPEDDVKFIKKMIKIHKKTILNFVDKSECFKEGREILPRGCVNLTQGGRSNLLTNYTNFKYTKQQQQDVVVKFFCLNCMKELDNFECKCKSEAIIPNDYLKMNGHTLSMGFLTKLTKKHNPEKVSKTIDILKQQYEGKEHAVKNYSSLLNEMLKEGAAAKEEFISWKEKLQKEKQQQERIKKAKQEQLDKEEQEQIINQKVEDIISSMTDEELENIKNTVMENITIPKVLITDNCIDALIFEYVKNT